MKARTMMFPLLLAMAFMLVGCAATSQDSGMSGDKQMSEGEGEMMAQGQGEMMAKGEGEMMAEGEGEMMAHEEMGEEHPPGCTCDACVAKAVDRLGFKVIEKEAQPYLATRFVMMADTPPEDMGTLMEEKFGMVVEALKSMEMQPAGSGFSLFYGEAEGGWDIAVGFVAAAEAQIEGFETGMLPGGEVLAAWHKGPYENLMQSYKAWEKFVADNEVVLTGPMVEMYKVSMQDVEDPAEYKTVLYQSIESKGKLGMMEGEGMMEDDGMKEDGGMMEEEPMEDGDKGMMEGEETESTEEMDGE